MVGTGREEERTMAKTAEYREPGFLVTKIMNPFVLVMMRLGLSVWGSRILEVRGRASGVARRTPVNLLDLDGRQYLVSPRGETQWVRNLRGDGGRLTLILGRRRDERTAEELPDSEKEPVLRSYLRKWKMEVGFFFDGVTADSTPDDILRIAAGHPVFVLSGPPTATGDV
jgi:deazaflavin-dependent oxidoreductase (nitroreductase family)